jgi:hypothetical protein
MSHDSSVPFCLPRFINNNATFFLNNNVSEKSFSTKNERIRRWYLCARPEPYISILNIIATGGDTAEGGGISLPKGKAGIILFFSK